MKVAVQVQRVDAPPTHIVFDAQLGACPADFFDPQYWATHGGSRPAGAGRGAAWFVGGEHGDWVLRHYRRGGKAAVLSADRYWYTGVERTRAFREWTLLRELYNNGLPVPRPIAARVERDGLFYRADLISNTIPGATTLSERLAAGDIDAGLMQQVGECWRRFYDFGVWHADLNAHNILLDEAQRVFLIDFDRSHARGDRGAQAGCLRRLRRSLNKLQNAVDQRDFDQHLWDALISAFRKSPVPP